MATESSLEENDGSESCSPRELSSRSHQRKVVLSSLLSYEDNNRRDDVEEESSTTTLDIASCNHCDDGIDGRLSPVHSNAGHASAVEEILLAISSFMLTPFRDESGRPLELFRGFCSIFTFGSILGLISSSASHHDSNSTFTASWYHTFSNIIGYTYTLCWSVAFYPQVISNYRRKTTKGLSADFILLNVVGFTGYAIYAGALLWSSGIRQTYEMKMHQLPTVQLNDFVLCLHVWLLSVFVCFQIITYDGFVWKRDITRPNQLLLFSMVIIAIGYPIVLVLFLPSDGTEDLEETVDDVDENNTSYQNQHNEVLENWLQYLYLLSYMKVLTTLVKYVPQALLNWKRKSTVGWNIWRSLLDLAGGLLSTAQLVGDAAHLGDWKAGVTGNPAKLGLGTISMVFSAIFIFQHYVLYAENMLQRPSTPSSEQDTVPLV